MTAAQPLQHVAAVVAELAQRVRQLERPRRAEGGDVVSSGHARLDALLPERGLRRGTLVEWLSTAAAAGAGTLALVAARQAAERGGPIVVVDRAGNFYPPGAQRLGIDLAPAHPGRGGGLRGDRSGGRTQPAPLATGGRDRRHAGTAGPPRAGPP